MAVHLTRIYTKTGDDGTANLGDMSRVSKTDPRVEAYADVNEANAALGVALALGGREGEGAALRRQGAADPVVVGAAPRWGPRSPPCGPGGRPACWTSARTCAPRWCRTRSGRRSGSRRTTPRGW